MDGHEIKPPAKDEKKRRQHAITGSVSVDRGPRPRWLLYVP